MTAADRTLNLARWRRLAEADFDAPDLLLWLSNVAAQIISADTEPDPAERPKRIMEAAGLAGKEDTLRRLRAIVRDADFHCDLIVRGRRGRAGLPSIEGRSLKHGERTRRRIEAIRRGMPQQTEHLTDSAIRSQITRALTGNP